MSFLIRRGPLAGILVSLSAATLLTASIAQAQAGEPASSDLGFCLTLPTSEIDPGFGRAVPDGATIDPRFSVERPGVCAPAPEDEPTEEATPEPALLRLPARS